MLSRAVKKLIYKKRKRGQKNKKRVYLRNKKGNLYVPREERAGLEEMSLQLFKSKRRYTSMAYRYNMDVDAIREEMERALGVIDNLKKKIKDKQDAESKEVRPEQSTNESNTSEGPE